MIPALQEHWQPFIYQQECGCLHWIRQLCDLARARPSPAHPVLQPKGELGHSSHQSCRHSLHPSPPQVQTHNCANTRGQQACFSPTPLTLLFAWFLAGLMITHQRVLMTGLSWPPIPGTRTPLERGGWRLKTSSVQVTMVKHWTFVTTDMLPFLPSRKPVKTVLWCYLTCNLLSLLSSLSVRRLVMKRLLKPKCL